jgi:hypothetical protein
MHAIIFVWMGMDTEPLPNAENEPQPPAEPLVQVKVRLEVPPGTRVRVDIEAFAPDGTPVDCKSVLVGEALPLSAALPASGQAAPAINRGPLRLPSFAGLRSAHERAAGVRAIHLPWAITLPAALMVLALGIYLFTRFYALPNFPIYFFTDEAVQTMSAVDLVNNHFTGVDEAKEFLPTYFENGSQFNLSLSVYLQVIPYLLFGKSIWVTRGVSVLVSLLGAYSVGEILRRAFKSPYPWLAVMVLSTTPVWFLHSRTAFETVLAASFFAAFLLTYLIYRLENPRYIFAAVVMGALTFYSYAPMRLVIGVAALLLMIVDWRYHWQNRKLVQFAFGLTLLLALPFIRFLINHPTESEWQLRLLGSYWLEDISLGEKLRLFAVQYLRGLDPVYWYVPNKVDLVRHIMLGYGHLLRQTLPLGLLGIGMAVFSARRSPAYRTILIAVLSVPTGAALVQIGATRLLSMVIPMAILTALALAAILEWLNRKFHFSRAGLALIVFVPLAVFNIYMLRDALVNGPLWFNDYGLGGMQYGGRQLFGEIKTYLREHPDAHLIVSPSWANGTDVIARFFFNDPLPFEMGSAKGYYLEAKLIDANTVFVMIPEEFDQLPRERFKSIDVLKTLPYPDGKPGFYFVHLQYVDNIADVVAKEREAKRQLQSQELVIAGETVKVSVPALDIGEAKNMFDGDLNTLARSAGINPMQVKLEFPSVREYHGVKVHIGGARTKLRVLVWKEGVADPLEFTQEAAESSVMRDIQVDFQGAIPTRQVLVEVTNTLDTEEGFVHVWEITLQ